MPTQTKSFSVSWPIVAAFAAVYLGWGSTYFAIRIALETLPGFFMAGVRFFTAGAMLYAYARLRGGENPTRGGWGHAFVTGALMLLVANGVVVYVERHVASGLTALTVASAPMIFLIVESLEKRSFRPGRSTLIGLVGGLIGVGLLINPWNESPDTTMPLREGAALLVGALSWVLGSFYSRRVTLSSSMSMASAMQMLGGGICLLAVSLLSGELRGFDWTAVSARSVLAVGHLIVIGSLIGYSSYFWLLRHVSPTQVSTYAYVNPVVAVLLGAAWGGEKLSGMMVVAAGIIVSSVALIVRRPV